MNTQTYYIHDNCGRPYLVKINDNTTVDVYARPDGADYDTPHDNLIYSYNPIKIFVGKSPQMQMTIFSGGHGSEFDGNTILLLVEADPDNKYYKYVFIGNRGIFSFTTENEIIEYVSPIGNSDVPYPYAIDKNNMCYLILDNVYFKINSNSMGQSDPYKYYWNISKMTVDLGSIPPYSGPNCNFENIAEWYVGKSQYTMTHSEDPVFDYHRLVDRETGNNKKMYIVRTTGEKVILSEQDYVDLMKRFSEKIGCYAIKNIQIIRDRF